MKTMLQIIIKMTLFILFTFISMHWVVGYMYDVTSHYEVGDLISMPDSELCAIYYTKGLSIFSLVMLFDAVLLFLCIRRWKSWLIKGFVFILFFIVCWFIKGAYFHGDSISSFGYFANSCFL